MSKARPSKLDPHAADLDQWFGAEKITCEEARVRLVERGCQVSVGRLSNWWAARQEERMREGLLDRLARGAVTARAIEAQFGKDPPPEAGTLVGLLKYVALQLTQTGTADDKVIRLVAELTRPVLEYERLKAQQRQLGLDERKVALLERKAAQAEAAKSVVESALSPDEKLARMRQIFGMS